MRKDLINKSKFLSLVLRHQPGKIGLKLDENGWANVGELLLKAKMTPDMLNEIVTTNNKKRFAFNKDKTKIRASQGHSINVDLQMSPRHPPDALFHGTAAHNWGSIKRDGLIKGGRQYVHLSLTEETALNVGRRHGIPIALWIDAKAMVKDGYKFYLSDNQVWLTDHVPPEYITYHT